MDIYTPYLYLICLAAIIFLIAFVLYKWVHRCPKCGSWNTTVCDGVMVVDTHIKMTRFVKKRVCKKGCGWSEAL